MDNLDPNAPQTETPAPEASPAAEARKAGPSYGSIIGIVLIVAVLVGGALYVWGERMDESIEVPMEGVRGGDANPEGALDGDVDASVEAEVPMPQ